jgi:hypothetical protein
MKFEEITKTDKWYTKTKNGKEITINIYMYDPETKKICATKQGNKISKWYDHTQYQNWFPKKIVKWVKQEIYI